MRASASSRPLLPVLLLFSALPASAQAPYKLPPKEVVDLVDAPPPPQAVVSPTGDAVLLAEPEAYPPIALLAEPVLRLGGVRISPATGCRQRTFRFTGSAGPAGEGRRRRCGCRSPRARGPACPSSPTTGSASPSPATSRTASSSGWATPRRGPPARSPASGSTTSSARRSGGRDEATLLARTVPAGRGEAPRAPAVPIGPIVEETAGKASQMATFQDLLRTPHDAAALRALRAGAARRRGRRGRDGLAARGAGALHRRRAVARRAVPPRRAGEGALLDAGALLLLRPLDRGLGRGRAQGGDGRRPAGLGRDPAPGRADRSSRGGLAAARAGDAPLARGPRRRRPDEEGRAPRARDDARRPLRRGALRGDAARAALRRPRLDRPRGRGPGDGVRPGPPLAHHVARRPRGARVRRGSSSTSPPTTPTAIPASR